VDDERDRAMRRAGQLLARRAHGRAELEQKLARRTDPALAADVAGDLAAMGYVDDGQFAAGLAQQRLCQGWGPLRIAHDLEVAGVPGEIAAAALTALERGAVDVAARRAIGGRTGVAALRRLGARGFDDDVAERLLDGS
jgi:SOS response regulatory protein OraA/RecX